MVTEEDIKEGVYRFETENACNTNNGTMSFFIENYLPDDMDIEFRDENYIEFLCSNRLYSAVAVGDGDFTHHRIEFEFIH